MLIDFPLSGYGTKYQSSKNTANQIGGLDPEPPQPWESEAEPAEERPWYVPIPRASGYRVQSYRSFKFHQLKTPYIYIHLYPFIRVKSHFVLVNLLWNLHSSVQTSPPRRLLVPGWTSLVASPKRSASTKWLGVPGFCGIQSWRAMVPWGSSKKIPENSYLIYTTSINLLWSSLNHIFLWVKTQASQDCLKVSDSFDKSWRIQYERLNSPGACRPHRSLLAGARKTWSVYLFVVGLQNKHTCKYDCFIIYDIYIYDTINFIIFNHTEDVLHHKCFDGGNFHFAFIGSGLKWFATTFRPISWCAAWCASQLYKNWFKMVHPLTDWIGPQWYVNMYIA